MMNSLFRSIPSHRMIWCQKLRLLTSAGEVQGREAQQGSGEVQEGCMRSGEVQERSGEVPCKPST